MMKVDKDKWIEDVLESMKGSQRAKPSPLLYEKIENRLDASKVKVIPMRNWGYAVGAAVLVLMLNVFAVRQYTQNIAMNVGEMGVSNDYTSQSLISNYKIYE